MPVLYDPNRVRPLVVGHRGAAADAPENTVASFRKALEIGVDMVETDIHPTSDGHLVAIHDATLDRTTDGHGLVFEHTLAQIRSLDAGSWFEPAFAGERVPTLDELLDLTAGGVPLEIEIKGGPIRYPGIEAMLAESLRRHNAAGRVVVISFDHGVLLALKRLMPEVATGVLFLCEPVEPSSLARAAEADAILPHWTNLSPEMVSEAHRHGLAVGTWTVDQESEADAVLGLGLDAIATNRPGMLVPRCRA